MGYANKGKCCFCGKNYFGFGNNPDPVAKDINKRCCDSCNSKIVIPARIKEAK